MIKWVKFFMLTLGMFMFVACGGGSDTNSGDSGESNPDLGSDPKSTLAGKTLYFSEGGGISSITFDEAMSRITLNDGTVLEIEKIVENKIYIYDEDEDGIYLLMAESTEKYIHFKKGDDKEGSDEVGFKAYFNQEDVDHENTPPPSSGEGAADILIGETFYDADSQEQTYTSTEWLNNSAIFEEHAYTGELLDSATYSATYSGKDMTIRDGEAYSTCSIERRENSIFMTCHNDTENWTGELWDTIELAKSHS